MSDLIPAAEIPATLTQIVVSAIRTLVPLIAGTLVAAGVDVGLADSVTTLIVSAVVYVAVRLMEEYVNPKLGWLLGIAKSPTY